MAWRAQEGPFLGTSTTLVRLDETAKQLRQPGSGGSPFAKLDFPPERRRYAYRFRLFVFPPQLPQDRAFLCNNGMNTPGYSCLQAAGECAFYYEFRVASGSFRGSSVPVDGQEELLCRAYFRPQKEPWVEALPDEPLPEPDAGAGEPRPEGACLQGTTRECYEGPPKTQGTGRCNAGTQTCQSDGTWGPCKGQVLPQTEVCNGKDDDCDGQTDDDFPQQYQSCQTKTSGPCKTHLWACEEGKLQCPEREASSRELCGNWVDDDCDGKIDVAPHCAWLRGVAAPQSRILKIAVSEAGNVFVAGVLAASELKPDGLPAVERKGSGDLFVAMLDSQGQWKWLHTVSAESDELFVRALIVDSQEGVYVAGKYKGSLRFGSHSLGVRGKDTAFIAKFQGQKWAWAKDIPAVNRTEISDAALGKGELYFAGLISQFPQFDALNVHVITSQQSTFIGAMSFDGKWKWVEAVRYLSSGDQWSFRDLPRIALHPNGDVLLSSYYRGSIALGPKLLPNPTSGGAYLAALSPDRKWRWVHSIDSSGGDELHAVAAHPNGTIAVAGLFASAPSFGIAGTTLDAQKGSRSYLAFLDAKGTWLHAMHLTKDAGSYASDLKLAYDLRGQLLVAGSSPRSLTFGSHSASFAGKEGDFLAQLDGSYRWQWAISAQALESPYREISTWGPRLSFFATARGDLYLAGFSKFGSFGNFSFPKTPKVRYLFVGRNPHHPK